MPSSAPRSPAALISPVALSASQLGPRLAAALGRPPSPMIPSEPPEAAALAARALLSMDPEALLAALDAGADLSEPLSGGRRAIELWGIGCESLGAEGAQAAGRALVTLIENGADPRAFDSAPRSPPLDKPRDAASALLSLAQRPAAFFAWLDSAVKIEALSGAMKLWEERYGLGRQQWLSGQRRRFGDRGATYSDRPAPAMALCLFKAFGKSVSPRHWEFFAESAYNAAFDMDLLAEALEAERPLMRRRAREMLAATALSNQSPRLLAAIASLPGGIGPSLQAQNLELMKPWAAARPPKEPISLLWACLALSAGSGARAPCALRMFSALASIEPLVSDALANPRPAALERASPAALARARELTPWMLEEPVLGAPWASFVPADARPGVFVELCSLSPSLACELLAFEAPSPKRRRANAASMAERFATRHGSIVLRPEIQAQRAQQFQAALALLERWELRQEALCLLPKAPPSRL